MQVITRSIHDLGTLPGLVKDYLSGKDELREFSGERPSLSGILNAASGRAFANEHRRILVDVLRDQYEGLRMTDPVSGNIEALLSPDVFTVTTGHQLNILTGPLFFIYKLASAVALSRRLNVESSGMRFVPVYWMATEDHDREEISAVEIPGERLVWETSQTGAVGRFSTEGLDEIIRSFRELQGHLGGIDVACEILTEAYASGNLAEATRKLVHSLFGEYGIVVLDASDARLKTLFVPAMSDELRQRSAERIVAETSRKLEDLGYTAQVNPRPVNLFYMHGPIRERIVQESYGFSVHGTDIRFSEKDCLGHLMEHPERFSPNVILRPLYQETILPNVAYIGGPGELSYWLQLQSLFRHANTPFPILVERDHALLLNRQHMRLIAKLGFGPDELLLDQPSALRWWTNRNHGVDLDQEQSGLEQLWDLIIRKAEEVDPTMGKMVAGEKQRQLNALQGVKSKLEKAIRKREEDSVRQIDTLWSRLYPEGSPQERVYNFFSFAADLDVDLLDIIIQHSDPLKAEFRIFVLDEQGFSPDHTAENPAG